MEEHAQPEEFVAAADFSPADSNQLNFIAGDRLLVHDKSSPDWWWAELHGLFGYVPSNHLQRQEEQEDVDDPWQDEEYYESYGTLKLHLEMLSDRPRTETYRRVMCANSTSLKGRVLLDVGCGTGIISLFCAHFSQPAVVYAVEASSMVLHTRQLVQDNGCEGTVTVIHSRVEDLVLPEKVDVLVSEWMGNCLLFEFMVESVLVARDRWLKEDGTMWPSSASLVLVPCEALAEYKQKVNFWEHLYGLDFSCLQPIAKREFFSKPKFNHEISPEDCLSAPSEVITLDMHTVQIPDLESMSGDFNFKVEKKGTLHGFTAWFSVQFRSLEQDGTTVELNTGPHSELTHWKQTLFMMDTPIVVNTGDCIRGTLQLRRNPVWRRHMTVTLQWNIHGDDERSCKTYSKSFPMWR